MKWNKRKTKVVEEQLEELSSPELEEIVDNKVDLDGATGDESSNNDLIDINIPLADEESSSVDSETTESEYTEVETTEITPRKTESELEPQPVVEEETEPPLNESVETSDWYDGSSAEVFEETNELPESENNSVIEPETLEEETPISDDEVYLTEEETHDAVETVIANVADEETGDTHYEPQPIEGEYMNENNLKAKESNIEKTVVDTVIVNNMVSSSLNSYSEAKPKKEYSVEELMVPDAKKGELVLARNEKVVKIYNVVKSANTGNAIVTNRRLIVDSDYRVDVPLEKVGCITSARVNEVKVVKIIIGILLIAICAFALIFDFSKLIVGKEWLGYVIIAVGALLGVIGLILVATSFKRRFALNIYTDDLYPVMAVSSRMKRKDGDLIGSIVTAGKGKDFEKFTLEIGGLLIQLKDALEEKL